jgi:hypothetical protein
MILIRDLDSTDEDLDPKCPAKAHVPVQGCSVVRLCRHDWTLRAIVSSMDWFHGLWGNQTFLSYTSQLFCHSSRKLTDTNTALPFSSFLTSPD